MLRVTVATLEREELLRRATELLPALRQRAARAEQLREIPPETVQDLKASGLIRIGNPLRYGGHGVEVDVAFDVSWELGRACGATAWCYALWTQHNWWLGHFPERCQEEFFATGPDTLFSSGLNPLNGRAERVSGGFRASGRWSFSSGCDAARWVMIACGPSRDDMIWLLVPREECEIVDTWFAAGLRGSGSKDVVVRDVFVPAHRAVDPNQAGVSDRTGWELHKRLSYAVPLRAFTGWALAAPIVGMAQGVIDEFTSRARRGTGAGRSADSVALQLRLAEASAEVHAARALHRHDIHEMLDKAARGEPFTPIDRARYLRDKSFVVKLSVQAVTRLFEASGARAVFDAEPIQRLFRDAHTASHHAALGWDVVAELYGRLALGPESA
jgi:3-hydroxy-9,10-secoandrosta-1,3,5(10)-triene-9,17-dione monooxygenase